MTDLCAVTLELEVQKNARIPGWLGRAAQANFFHTLEAINPALSKTLHDVPGAKPFTSSTLMQVRRENEMTLLQPGDRVQLRYTTLHPQLTALFQQGMLPQWSDKSISVHDQRLRVKAIRAQENMYRAFIDKAQPDRYITLNFISPTSFKRTGGYFTPLPQPELVFSSLLDRWNAFAPFQLPEALYDHAHNDVMISALVDVQTQTLSFARGNKGTITGFTGQVSYRIQAEADVRRYFQALGLFAAYSGVGVKTTVGMGQVTSRK